VDLILENKAEATEIVAPESNTNFCIHYKHNLLKEDKMNQVKSHYPSKLFRVLFTINYMIRLEIHTYQFLC
jgi:hypothetical protein